MDEKKSEKKDSFLKRVWLSIKCFEKYQEFAMEKIANSLKYIFLLVLIFVFFISISMTYKIYTLENKAIKYYNENIPNFTYADGILKFEQNEPIIIQNNEDINIKIIIDTSDTGQAKLDDYKSDIVKEANAIVLLKDKMLLKTEMLSTVTETTYQDFLGQYDIQKLDKNIINEYFTGQNIFTINAVMFFMFLIYFLPIYFITTLLDVFIFAILSFITCRIFGMKVRMTANFNIVVHAITLPILLNSIYVLFNSITGIYIEYFQVMYIGITYIYIITAILMIRSNLIKQQMEIGKIIEEQKKIKKEIKENEETRNENKDINKDEKNKKEEKKEKDTKEGSGELEGDNA